MSPEVLLYNTPANPSIDVWALGIILYRMLHGYFLYETIL
jgi:serine/threonine protein kinase